MSVNVLVFASQKGGSGKSTMAASVAVAAVEAGESVVAVDMDPQGTLAEWGRLREAGDIVFRSVEAAKLTAWIEDVRSRGKTSLLVIDTPGTFGPAVNRAMREASLCLVPVRPSAPDLKAAAPTVEAIQTL
ncbi:ParA family protein, partial [Methylobacterium sp. 88A]|uniref:ParA family protein n=1 Tax=Methylobacterium sp. 88A TaxID=1131813 RepID=UPI0012F6E9C6